MKIIVDDKIPYIRGQVERLADEVCYMRGSDISAADVRDADVLIVRTRTRVDETLLQGSRVGLVVTATIGFDHIDTEWLEANAVEWTNCPGCNATSVAQYVRNSLLLLPNVVNRTDGSRPLVGIVGMGHVGTAVASSLRDAGMDIAVYDPPKFGLRQSLNDFARPCDVITFHTPLTRDTEFPTYHMADASFFNSLERQPIVVNAARGGVVDEQALLTALDSGLVSDAIVDTWEGEPDINRELMRRAFIATPHIAGYSADGKANATRMSLEAVARYMQVEMEFDIVPPPAPEGYHYDPREDSQRLKSAPERFEELRGSYPLRRET